MRIQHNIAAMSAYRNYTNNVSAVNKNLEKLSSGYKINRAGDDAAGLAISEKMRAQITGLETAQKNAKDGISLVKTAEGALQEVHDMLNRMVTLATQSANGTYDNETDRVQLQKELDQLRTEIDRIADSANFNGIKLFDGSLSGADITTTGLETTEVDMAAGVEVVQGTNGGGTKGEYTINIGSALGNGDVLELKFGGSAETTVGNSGVLQLTYGTSITAGKTTEEQASNVAKALKAAGLGADFDIEAKGNSIVLTSKVEGSNLGTATADEPQTSSLMSASVTTDKVATKNSWTETAGVDDTDGVASFAGLIEANDGTGIDISSGDTVSVEVTLANGQKLTVKAVAGEDFEMGATNVDAYDNLMSYLNDKATFEDDSSTVVDESKVKFGDLLKVVDYADSSDSTKGWEMEVQNSLVAITDGSEIKVTVEKPDGTTTSMAGDTAGSDANQAASGSAAKAAEYNIDLASSGSNNLSIGDKLTIKGKLTDGRTFEIKVEAGKDFDVGAAYVDTLTNLQKVLESDTFQVQLKNEDGSEGAAVKGSDIFGANAEISLDTTAGAEKFTSNNDGTIASHITEVELENGEASAVSTKMINGTQRTSADSTITLSEGVSYGAVVEVDGKKYELVKSASDVSNSTHKAVVVDDISDTSSAAKALATAIKGDLDAANYKVTSSGGTVTVATTKVGSTAKAVTASASGDKTTQIEFTLDPSKMKEGSTVTINGQTYEFTGADGKTSKKEYIGLSVSNFAKESASSLGSALAKAANGQKNASVTVDENGKVTVRGLLDSETNKIVTPSVKFDGGTSGLTLQIGDTADDYNKMTVSIYNMHCADMGIGNISIADQDSAAAAIDAIRSAINYVSDVRGTLGATQNRLDHTINNLSVMQENIQDAESTIRDTDIAAEMMAYTKNNILVQSAQAMLAQANQIPQGVLQLLG